MSLHSVILFTKSITFNADDEFIQPQNWEKVLIPDNLFQALFRNLFPDTKDELYDQIINQTIRARCDWLLQLAQEGYTAVRITVPPDGNVSFIAEATKDKLR
jgi:hypothetical protein